MFHTFIEGSESEFAHERQQLLVRRWLAELPIRLRCVKDVFAFVVHGLHNRVRELLDADFLIFADGKNHRLDVVVLAQLPDKELREIA